MRNGSTRILRVSRADCAEHGRLCQPICADTLDEVADQLLRDEPRPPRTRAELSDLLDRADALAKRIVGAELPRASRDVELLLQNLCVSTSTPHANGRRLLTALVAEAMIRDGATWVDAGDAIGWDDWQTCHPLPPDDPFAATAHPATVAMAWLDDSEGGYSFSRPAPDGVPRLVGVDRAALVARARSLAVPGLRSAIAGGRTAEVAKVLFARPGNRLLRETCYLALAEFEHLDAIREVAARFVRSDDAAAIDHVALLNVQLHGKPEGDAAGQLFEAALAAVRRHPRDARLALALAQAAERAFPGEPAKAVQCYERVLRISNYGDGADAARAAIERLTK